MIAYESSSRLPMLVMGVALVALALGGSAQAAGGSPVPVPDDPPPGIALTRVKVVQPVAAPRATKEAAATPTTQASVPTPDPPVVPTTAKQPEAQAPRGAGAGSGATTPTRVSRPSSPRVVARTVAPVAAPVVTTRRATTQPMVVKRSARAVERKNPPPPKTSKSSKTRVARVSEPLVRLPHDALRLGLPVGALIVGRPGAEPDAGLLALAGLLLVVAAAGTLVVGVAAREALGRA